MGEGQSNNGDNSEDARYGGRLRFKYFFTIVEDTLKRDPQILLSDG